MTDVLVGSSVNLKTLLDRALCQGGGDSGEGGAQKDIDSPDGTKSQVDLTTLHKLLHHLIEGQTTLLLTANEQEARINDIEGKLDEHNDRIEDLLKWTEHKTRSKTPRETDRPISQGSTRSQSSTALGKSPLPPIGSSESVGSRRASESIAPTVASGILRRQSLKQVSSSTSALRLAQASVMNFADKYDLEKLNTRINLLQTKLDKLTDIVPSNEQIISDVIEESKSEENIAEATAAESWSKHVLTKRIESNEESLEKFMQLIDDLGKKIKGMQSNLVEKLKEATGSSASSDQVQEALDQIKQILSRLAKMEKGMSHLDSMQKRLAALAKSQEELSGEGDSRHSALEKSLKHLEDMLMALDKQCRGAAQQLSHLQASVAAAAEGGTKVEYVAPPPQPIEPVRDMETIRALGELSDRVGTLDEKVVGLQNMSHIEQSDLDIMKASILEEVPVFIENALENIISQLNALQAQNDRLNEIIEIKAKREEEQAPEPPRPTSRPSSAKVNIDRLASKENLEQVKEKLENSTQQLDDRISGEIASLHEKIGSGSESLWAELAKMKENYQNFDNDLSNLRSNVLQKLSNPSEAGVPLKADSSLSEVNTLSPALAALLDRMQKKTFELGERLEDIGGGLARLDEDGRQRGGYISDILEKIKNLQDSKADKEDVSKLDEQKADKSELDMKVSRDDFDGAIEDMSKQLEGLVGKMLEVEESWKTSLDQTNARLKKTLNSDDMDAFKRSLESRLKSLKTLLESTRHEEGEHATECSGDAALFRKPLMGYKCVTCDKVTFPTPGFPVASIPVQGNLPHMNTIRPYTTFDLHNIREQSKLKKTGYEERVWLRMKTNLDRSYRQHVAESMNYAFNAFEQGATETIPITGGASIPKSYHIAPAGRSCGGGHTRTNPHVRFTHLKNLAEIWQEEPASKVAPETNQPATPATGGNAVATAATPAEEIAAHFEESRREVQILGQDGHVYKGRADSSGQ